MSDESGKSAGTSKLSGYFHNRLKPADLKLKAESETGPKEIRDWIRGIDSIFLSTPESKSKPLSDVIRTALGEARKSRIINDRLSKYMGDEASEFTKTPTNHGAKTLKVLNDLMEAVEAKDCGSIEQMSKLFERLGECTRVIGSVIYKMADTEDGATPDSLQLVVKMSAPKTSQPVPTLEEAMREYKEAAKEVDCDTVLGTRFEDLQPTARKVDREFYLQVFTHIPIEHNGVKGIIEECRDRGITSTLAVVLEALDKFGPETLFSQAESIRKLQEIEGHGKDVQTNLTQAIT